MINVYIEICKDGIELPAYANSNDSCMDIRASEDVELDIGETKIIPTGLKMAIPIGYELEVRPRSGISLKTPLRVANSPGTIDSGYRDEIGIIMTNTSNYQEKCLKCVSDNDCNCCNFYLTLTEKNNTMGVYKIFKGERIAQIKLSETPKINFVTIDDITTIGSNRHGGYGSSGIT